MRPLALVALAGIALAGCAGAGTSAGTAPLAVVHAAGSSFAAQPRSVQRRPAVPAHATKTGAPTPPGPPRPARGLRPARALPVSDAPRLAAPACEQFADGLAGRYPQAVLARGSSRALALLTDSTAAALLGMPVSVPAASLPARERLDGARARLSSAIAAGDDARAAAIAKATAGPLRDYAAALGIAGCG